MQANAEQTAADLNYDEIEIGRRASFKIKITEQAVSKFAELSGDFNPLHMDSNFAEVSEFGRRVVHGMYLAAQFSRLVGMYLPGKRCLYLSQSVDFILPAFIDDEIEVVGEVQRKQDDTKSLVIRTEIIAVPDRLLVRGKAIVRVR